MFYQSSERVLSRYTLTHTHRRDYVPCTIALLPRTLQRDYFPGILWPALYWKTTFVIYFDPHSSKRLLFRYMLTHTLRRDYFPSIFWYTPFGKIVFQEYFYTNSSERLFSLYTLTHKSSKRLLSRYTLPQHFFREVHITKWRKTKHWKTKCWTTKQWKPKSQHDKASTITKPLQ
jgi:hypothetical protein